MIYYSLQNKKTKKLIKVYSTIFYSSFSKKSVQYRNVCYIFSEVGNIVWLVSEETAKRALETPNFFSEDKEDYDNPSNELEVSEWEVVEVTLNVKDPAQSTIEDCCENTVCRKLRRALRK